jgi:hypothetical protein
VLVDHKNSNLKLEGSLGDVPEKLKKKVATTIHPAEHHK